jgi:type VI protein secretion system component Hcp
MNSYRHGRATSTVFRRSKTGWRNAVTAAVICALGAAGPAFADTLRLIGLQSHDGRSAVPAHDFKVLSVGHVGMDAGNTRAGPGDRSNAMCAQLTLAADADSGLLERAVSGHLQLTEAILTLTRMRDGRERPYETVRFNGAIVSSVQMRQQGSTFTVGVSLGCQGLQVQSIGPQLKK